MQTLYQKYRSQSFADLYGQEHIRLTLENEIEEDSIAHAYLFCGPRAVGKTSIARILAKAINCLNRKKGEHEPCNQCEACLSITAGKSIDILEMDAASHTGVENIRENVIEASRVSPAILKYKIFIIDEVHMLSTSAFNALLKVMEEPPKNVLFILCTTEIHKIPLTIISRCQRFDFKRISIPQIVKKLGLICESEKIKVEQKVLEEIARRSEGHMRDAESLLGQVIAISGKEITAESASLIIPRSDLAEVIKLIDLIVKKNTGLAIEFVNKMLDEGVDLKIFANELVEMLRRLMLLKIDSSFVEKLSLEIGESLEQELNKIALSVELNVIITFLEKFIFVKEDLKKSFIIQLPFEIAIVELCEISSLKNIEQNYIKQEPVIKNEKIAQEKKVIIENINDNNLEISEDTIRSKWGEVENIIKKNNHSLASILNFCKTGKVKNGFLDLTFKFKIHQDRIEHPEIKLLIETSLETVFGRKILIKTELDANMQQTEKTSQINIVNENNTKNNSSDDEMMDNLLKTFGGKIIG